MKRGKPFTIGVLAGLALFGGESVAELPHASADHIAYLINVKVRPGYNFASDEEALDYGHGLCQKVAEGRTYGHLVADVKADFATADEFQASYLITQAVNELCPQQIWQLRNSASGYRPVG